MILVAVQPLSEIRLIVFLSRPRREARPRFLASSKLESSSASRYPYDFLPRIAKDERFLLPALAEPYLLRFLCPGVSFARGNIKHTRNAFLLLFLPHRRRHLSLIKANLPLAPQSRVPPPPRGRTREIGRWTLC